jgi:peptidoglycan/LPS O-acetylase OafA/YrhL
MVINDISREKNHLDRIRLIASLLVLIGHAPILLYNHEFSLDPFRFLIGIPMHYLGVLIFFSISGFLLAKSWEDHNSLVSFVVSRVLRIFPLLIVIILLSVFLIGPVFTNLDLLTYFSSPRTYIYLKDITLYRMYYELPGVFLSNPHTSSMNGSLWTLPYEFTCYLILLAFGLIRRLKLLISLSSLYILLFVLYFFAKTDVEKIVIPVLGIDFEHFFELLIYFLTGSLFYTFRKHIIYKWYFSFVFLFLLFLCNHIKLPLFLQAISLSYLILHIAFLPRNNSKINTDISYSLYLIAYPIQQMILSFFGDSISLYFFLFLTLLISLPIAYFLTIKIEIPCLNQKKKLVQVIVNIKSYIHF